jgi:hypothetical protein
MARLQRTRSLIDGSLGTRSLPVQTRSSERRHEIECMQRIIEILKGMEIEHSRKLKLSAGLQFRAVGVGKTLVHRFLSG